MRALVRVVILIAAAAIAWNYRGELRRYIPAAIIPSPHEQYASAIRARGLDDTELGRRWLESATAAVEHPRTARSAFTDEGTFGDDDDGASAWRFSARRGQRITASVEFAAGQVFVDLISVDGKNAVASGTSSVSRLSHDIREDGDFVLRVQPELLRGGPYRVTQATEASLDFPLAGIPARAVQGRFGDPRSGGRRHEGIDIFAPRGTPAVAAVDGWITGSTTNRLGGNVVWLWSPRHRVSLYYAHLDRQAVSRGERVRAGDVVGYVGTTGNARGTAPHLHFGIYARGEGAVDPVPFVVDPVVPPAHKRRDETASKKSAAR